MCCHESNEIKELQGYFPRGEIINISEWQELIYHFCSCYIEHQRHYSYQSRLHTVQTVQNLSGHRNSLMQGKSKARLLLIDKIKEMQVLQLATHQFEKWIDEIRQFFFPSFKPVWVIHVCDFTCLEKRYKYLEPTKISHFIQQVIDGMPILFMDWNKRKDLVAVRAEARRNLDHLLVTIMPNVLVSEILSYIFANEVHWIFSIHDEHKEVEIRPKSS